VPQTGNPFSSNQETGHLSETNDATLFPASRGDQESELQDSLSRDDVADSYERPEQLPIVAAPVVENDSGNNRIAEMHYGSSLITYALVGDNRRLCELRGKERDTTYRRPFLAEGAVCPPLLVMGRDGEPCFYLPLPHGGTTSSFVVHQRARGLDVSSRTMYVSANKLIVEFKDAPEEDVVYISPGKQFPEGVVAFRAIVDHANSTSFKLLTESRRKDDSLLEIFLARAEAFASKGIHAPVKLEFVPKWIFRDTRPKIVAFVEGLGLGCIPKSMRSTTSVAELKRELLAQLQQDIDSLDEDIKDLDENDPEMESLLLTQKERLVLYKELNELSDEEFAEKMGNLAREAPECMSSHVTSIGSGAKGVQLRDEIVDEHFTFYCEKLACALKLSTSCQGQINTPTLRAEGLFYPTDVMDGLELMPTPAFDVVLQEGSPLLMQCMSIANLAMLLQGVSLAKCRFEGKVYTSTRSAVPFEGSQGSSIKGSNRVGFSWNELQAATVTCDTLVYAYELDNVTHAVKTLCDDVNALIMYEVVHGSVDVNNLLQIPRAERARLHGESALLPQSQDIANTVFDTMSSQLEIQEVLKISNEKEFIKHPLNLLAQVPEVARRVITCDDPNVAIGSEDYLTLGEMSLRVLVKTDLGVGVYHLPPSVNAVIKIDTAKTPGDAWNENIASGVMGLPEPPDPGESGSDPLQEFVGFVPVQRARLRAAPARNTGGYGEERPRPAPPDRPSRRPASRTAESYSGSCNFNGLWHSIPESQRPSYETDLKKAIFAGWRLLESHVPDGDKVFQGLPIQLLKDALSGNRHLDGCQAKTNHNYRGSMPHSRNKIIPSMTVGAFRKWAEDSRILPQTRVSFAEGS